MKSKSKKNGKPVFKIVKKRSGRVIVHDPVLTVAEDDMSLTSVRHWARYGKRMGYRVDLKGFDKVEVETILKNPTKRA